MIFALQEFARVLSLQCFQTLLQRLPKVREIGLVIFEVPMALNQRVMCRYRNLALPLLNFLEFPKGYERAIDGVRPRIAPIRRLRNGSATTSEESGYF